MHTCTSVYRHMHKCIHIHVSEHTLTYAQVCTHTYTGVQHTCECIYTYTCLSVYIHMHKCITLSEREGEAVVVVFLMKDSLAGSSSGSKGLPAEQNFLVLHHTPFRHLWSLWAVLVRSLDHNSSSGLAWRWLSNFVLGCVWVSFPSGAVTAIEW